MSNSHKCWQNQQEKTQEKFRRLRLHELCRKSLHRWKMVKVYISLSTDENVSCDVWIWDIVDGRIIIGEGRENRNRSPSFPTDGRGGRSRRIESARGQQLLRRNALQFVRRSVVRPSVRGAGASEEGREIVANFAAVTIASRYAPFPSSSFHLSRLRFSLYSRFIVNAL